MLLRRRQSHALRRLLLGCTLIAAFFLVYMSSLTHAASPTVSLWTNTDTPQVINQGDPGAVELGLKFRSSEQGRVTGVRFYKSSANNGTHIGNLWSSDGVNLATVTFTNETASGWQTALFATPVTIQPNTTYIVSYYAPEGEFSIDPDYFATTSHTKGPLTGLKDGVDGANSVYTYSASSTYPSLPSSSDNYWVDVTFVSDGLMPPLNVTATQYLTTADVAWSAGINSQLASAYRIYRSGSLIGTVDGNTFHFVDETAVPATPYTYTVKAVDATQTESTVSNSATLTMIPSAHASVKAIDSANTINDPNWFVKAYNEGFRLYIMHSTAWGTCDPWYNTQNQLKMALDAGLKIAVYTRQPECWKNGILAAGPYIDQLQFFALDVETGNEQATRDMVDGIKALNVRPIIYSGSGMWATEQGADADDFTDVPLWDTNTGDFDYATWAANYLAPTPVVYSGWNTASNMRIGVQQQFEYTLNGVDVDLNSFDETFLNAGPQPITAQPISMQTPVTTAPVSTESSPQSVNSTPKEGSSMNPAPVTTKNSGSVDKDKSTAHTSAITITATIVVVIVVVFAIVSVLFRKHL